MAIIAVLLVTVCVITDAAIDRSTDKLMEHLNKIEKAADPYHEAFLFYEYWEQESLTWLTIISHLEVDNITAHIHMMLGYANTNSPQDFWAELTVTKEMIVAMHDKTHLNWANVL